ncbi:MAG: acetolactate synthase small subunit [Deltaproteobacteria bacterium]|nr:acetolactate synthase small subunit [Deltaproteobacteria bacterium]
MIKQYTISALTANAPGVLHRLASVLTQRRVNIESLNVKETETKGVSRFSIVVFVEESAIEQIVSRMRRVVEVFEVSAG